MSKANEVFQRLKGPVVPLNICFTDDDEIDYPAMRRYVDWLCRQKTPVLLLTFGSSEFAWLSEEDIYRLTADLAEEIAGRSLFVASTGLWAPQACCRFARHVEQAGADALKVEISPELLAGSEQAKRRMILHYFDRVQDAATIPLLGWVDGSAQFPADVLIELAKRPQVVGAKNDGDQFYFYYDITRATAEEDFAVISGGQMRNFVFGYQIGSPAYLCTIAPFRPDIALAFCDLLTQRRFDEAWQMVFRYEDPWLRLATSMDWLASIKTAICLHGLVPNNRLQPPELSHTAEQRETIRQGLEQIFGPIEKIGL